MEVIDGFSYAQWIAARRCFQAAENADDIETARSLRRASRRLLNASCGMDGHHRQSLPMKRATGPAP